jgi:hypothetical protein
MSLTLSLQKALYTLFKEDSALQKMIGNRIYDFVPKGTEMPYIVFGEDKMKSWSTATTEGWSLAYVIHVWGNDQSLSKVRGILEQLTCCIRDANLTLDGYQIVYIRPKQSQTYLDKNNLAHGILTLDVLTHQTNESL